MESPCKPVFLVGPTAVGKSEVAISVAEELRAEIVSADSMQVYRGMDIGTAKPTPEERARVRHHLIDVVDVSQPFDVARYRQLAKTAIEESQRRGRLPLVVGGSGMYLRALTEGLFDGPGADPSLRRELEALTAAELHERLAKADPAGAAKIGAHNHRRLVRALEVFALTGKPISTQQREWTRPDPERPVLICLQRDRADLFARIEARVDRMFARGLVEETRGLLSRGLAENPTARAAAGYREVIEMLQGARGLDETIERVKVRTRQLARRQLTWFRHQARLELVKVEQTGDRATNLVRAAIENVRSQNA